MNARRVMTWLIFWSSVALALSALAWVSVEVVSLERREAESRTQATRQEAIRRALWRLDSTMAPVLAVEAARPSSEFVSLQSMWSQPAYGMTAITDTEAVASIESYARNYFNYSYDSTTKDELVMQLQSPQTPASAYYIADEALLDAQMDADVQAETSKISKESESDYAARSRIAQIATNNASQPQQDLLNEDSAPSDTKSLRIQESLGMVSPDTLQRDEADAIMGSTTSLMVADGAAMGQVQDAGSLTPRWIHANGESKLVLVRNAFINGQMVVQGVELDWDALQRDLLRSISDVLPGASLVPSNTQSLGAYRMATIPVALIPPPSQALPAWAWSPARVGLVVTWIAIIATIVAVGVVLRAAIVLSDRRGRFVSAVTHELRTPLTTFRLYSQMLADGMVTDEQVRRDYLTTLKRESERLTGIVENVLEYARLSRARPGRSKPEGEQSLSPGALVARFRPGLARRLGQHNMDLVASLDLEEHQNRTVTVDPHAVERVMMNLIENACKYACAQDDENEQEEHDTRVHLDVGVRDGMLEMLIADHGPGIETSERARIFGEFQRGRRGLGNARSGLGLGLALSRGLAREMGGDLELVHRRGHGAEFLLTIPLDAESN